MSDSVQLKKGRCGVLMADNLPCGRPIVEDEVCIMHLRQHQEPKGDEFDTELHAVFDGSSVYSRHPEYIDGTGFYFPDDFRLSAKEFAWNRPAVFRRARFFSFLMEEKTIFESEVDFSNAVFIDFRGSAEFLGPARFREADFDKLKIHGAVFRDVADFSRAKTEEDSYLSKCIFHREAILEGMKTGELHCGGTEFRGPLVLRDASFRYVGGFSTAKFAGPIDARRLRVRNLGDSDPFVSSASSVDFSGASFDVPVSFRGMTINEKSSFHGATFAADVSFADAEFQKGVSLSRCSFGALADFSGTRVSGFADFSHARFAASAVFADTSFVGVASFEAAQFSQPERVYFVRVNDSLDTGARLILADAIIDGVHIEAINWHRRAGRLVLEDELQDRDLTHRQAESIENVYRRLFSVFRKSHRYDDAEDCVMGAMEMRRRNPRVDRMTRLVMWLYKLASFYGSSYRRAFGVFLLLLLLLFPALYMLGWSHLRYRGAAVDFRQATAHQHSSRERDRDHLLLVWRDWFRLYRAAALYSVELAMFRDEPSFELASPVRGVALVEPAIIAAQLALLLLAVRRRFA